MQCLMFSQTMIYIVFTKLRADTVPLHSYASILFLGFIAFAKLRPRRKAQVPADLLRCMFQPKHLRRS
jgi:hypothetical protein